MKHQSLYVHIGIILIFWLTPQLTEAQLSDCEEYGSAQLAMAELYVDLAELALDLVTSCNRNSEACALAHDFLYRAEDILTVIFNGHSTGGCIDCDLTSMIDVASDIKLLGDVLYRRGRNNQLGNVLPTLLDWKNLTCNRLAQGAGTTIQVTSPDIVSATDQRGVRSASTYPCTSMDMAGMHNGSFWGTGGAIKLYKHGNVFCNKKGGWFMVLESNQVVKYQIDKSRNEYLPVEYMKIKDIKYVADGKTRYITEANYWLTVY